MNKLDWSNGVVCKNGNEAEVFLEKDGSLYGRYKWASNQDWYACRWNLNGALDNGTLSEPYHLIPKPLVTHRVMSVKAYSDGMLSWSTTQDYSPDKIKITFTNGKLDTSVAPEWVK